MDSRLVEKYFSFVDQISLQYEYDGNIKHLLYLIIPAFVSRYGFQNERLILDVFQHTIIRVQEDNHALEEACYTAIPKLVLDKVIPYHFIILKKYSKDSLVQLLDNLIHEFNHALHSFRKEIQIEKEVLKLRTGLTHVCYKMPELTPLAKENTYLLEEILNTIQTEEMVNLIKSYRAPSHAMLMNTVEAINHETETKYRSKSYYLETVLFQHILENRTFTSTLNRLRLSGDIDDIEGWFDNITGILHSYQDLNHYLVKIMELEIELGKRKYFKGMVISKIRNLLEKCFVVIDTFNQNCHYK